MGITVELPLAGNSSDTVEGSAANDKEGRSDIAISIRSGISMRHGAVNLWKIMTVCIQYESTKGRGRCCVSSAARDFGYPAIFHKEEMKRKTFGR